MISQIRRAALSVPLNISEGASRKSETERKRYYEVQEDQWLRLMRLWIRFALFRRFQPERRRKFHHSML
jgi:hypothetical protein